MGVSLDVYRCRIGCFRPRGSCWTAGAERKEQTKASWSRLHVFVLALLLLIAGIEPNPGPDHRCKFCSLLFGTPQLLCEHLKIHESTKNFSVLCTFGCGSVLASVASLRAHFFKYHKDQARPQEQQLNTNSKKCPFPLCSVRFITRKDYSTHMVQFHLLKSEPFQCIWDDCKTQLQQVKQFHTHMSRYHSRSQSSSDIFVDDNASTSDNESHTEGDLPAEDFHIPEDPDLYPDHVIKKEVAAFYLKLESQHLLPTSAVQAISEEITVLTELTHHCLKKSLKEELGKLNLDPCTTKVLIEKVFKNDTVFNIHHKHEDVENMGSNHMRMQYWQKYFPFVEPQRITLKSDGSKKRYAHHVPIRETLSVLLKDEHVKELVLQSFNPPANSQPEILSDFTDGSAFQDHAKCNHGGSRKCLQLIIFQDGLEFNAFGSSTGLYKPNPFYYTLGNLPPEYRTNLDLIQLCYMILDKDLKTSQEEELNDIDKLKIAMKPLLDELEDLKKNGIQFNGASVPVCLLFLVGDSLGQHLFGGFVKNFSNAEFWCRFCPMSKTEFHATPSETKPFRTVTEYDEYVKIAKEKWLARKGLNLQARKRFLEARRKSGKVLKRNSVNKTSMNEVISKSAYQKLVGINFRGVKYRASPFNSSSLGFHVISAQPPCIAHDLFEGAVKKILAEILRYFIETKEWFDLSLLNRRIKEFKCKGSDALDAPTPLKNLDSLSGGACENWTLLRLLPFIIGDLIKDKTDPMWMLYLQMKEIVEYVCAPRITLTQINYLQSLIRSFLTAMKNLLPNSLIPKLHFLCHYPSLILLFGPLIRLFTLRYESKHMFFKQVARACRNYINITYTLSKKYMCRFAYDHISDIIRPDVKFKVSSAAPVNIDEVKAVLHEDLNFDDFEELKKVTIRGIEYTQEQYLVIRCDDTCSMVVGIIYKILLQINSNKVFFLVNERQSNNSGNGYFEVQKSSSIFKLMSLDEFADFYPLSSYLVNCQDCISLKRSTIAQSY